MLNALIAGMAALVLVGFLAYLTWDAYQDQKNH